MYLLFLKFVLTNNVYLSPPSTSILNMLNHLLLSDRSLLSAPASDYYLQVFITSLVSSIC